MKCFKKLKLLLVGAGGYGRFYLEALARPEILEKVEFLGVVEPFLNRETEEKLKQRNLPVFEDMKSAYKALGQIDLTCIVTPLPFHLEHIRTALAHGSHVLCEKPAAPVMEQLEPMIELEKNTGKCLAIGFQWSFAPAMLRCKKDILSGLYGNPVSAKALVLWPRPESYFKRGSGWGGKRAAENGTIINDSVASNATAHYLHNLYFMLGESMKQAAIPTKMQVSVARANKIENYDTVCIKATMKRKVELLYLASHAVDKTQNPLIEYRFENAAIRYDCETNHLTAYFNDGSVKKYGIVEADVHTKLEAVIDGIRNGNYESTVCCTPSTCKPHVWTVDQIYRNDRIFSFPQQKLRFYHPEDMQAKGVFVDGLWEACQSAYEKNEFLDFEKQFNA